MSELERLTEQELSLIEGVIEAFNLEVCKRAGIENMHRLIAQAREANKLRGQIKAWQKIAKDSEAWGEELNELDREHDALVGVVQGIIKKIDDPKEFASWGLLVAVIRGRLKAAIEKE